MNPNDVFFGGFDSNNAFDLAAFEQPQQRRGAGQQQKKKKDPGLLEGIIRGAVEPFSYLINSSIVNPIKENAAILSGNEVARNNVGREFNEELGLGAQGTDLAGGAKKWAGNSLGALLTVGAPGASSIKGGAAVGAGLGGSAALAQEGSSLEDVLTGAGLGGVTGGALAGGGKLLGKFGSTGDAAATRGVTGRTSQNLLGDAWGIKTGSKIGNKVVTPQEANTLQRFVVDKIGVPKTASADMVFERAVNFSNETGNAISTAIKTSGKKLGNNDINGLTSSLEGKFSKVLGADYNTNATAQGILNRVKSAKTPDELWSLAKEIDDELINFNRNNAAADPVVERFAQIARDDVRGALNKAIPELKGLNSAYGQAKQVEQLVAKSANNPRGLNVFGNKIGGGIAQRGKAGIGQLTDSVPSLPRFNAPGILPDAAGIGARAATGGLVSSMMQPQYEDEVGALSLEDALMQSGGMGSQMGGAGLQPEQPQQEMSPYSRENLMADIQRDPRNADKYIATFESLQEIYKPSEQDSLQLSDSAIKNVNDLQGALFDIDSLGESISSSNVSGPISGYRSLNPFDTEAKSLQSEVDRVRQVVGKALEGGVLRKEDEIKYAKILPTVKDTKEVAANKLRQLKIKINQDLNNYVSLQQQTGKGRANTLSDALLMQQGAAY